MFTKTAPRARLRPVGGSVWGLAPLILALVVTGCVQVRSGDGGFVMGQDIVVKRGETSRNDIVAVGGNVRVDGRATRDVVVIGGRLTVNGEVERSVTAIGGSLRLGPGARVGRDLVAVAASVDRHDSARIGGEFVTVSVGYGFADFFAPMNWGWGGWWGLTPFAWVQRTGQLFYWLLLALLAVALAGDRVSSASHAIAREPLRMAAIGVVGLFALCFGLVVFLVLSVLIIGIPFLLALIFVWWVAYIFGGVAVFQAVGNRVMYLAGRPDASQVGIVLVGGLVVGIVRYVPFFGGLVWFVVALVGLGSVFATRFGTGSPWIRTTAQPVAPGASPYAADPGASPSASSAFEGPAAGEIAYEEPAPAATDGGDTEPPDDDQRG